MQAVEAKEGVEIQNETITMASISYQNFFRGYKKKSGMTGTAATETAEFSNIYELTTSVIPSNRPNVRKDNSDVVFKSTEGMPVLLKPCHVPYAVNVLLMKVAWITGRVCNRGRFTVHTAFWRFLLYEQA